MPQRIDNRQRLLPIALPNPVWRPIHYLGSKLRLTESIRELIDRIDPTGGAICDLFAGSGTVSFALSHSRCIVSADIQEYSRVICTALLKPVMVSEKETFDYFRRAATKRTALQEC